MKRALIVVALLAVYFATGSAQAGIFGHRRSQSAGGYYYYPAVRGRACAAAGKVCATATAQVRAAAADRVSLVFAAATIESVSVRLAADPRLERSPPRLRRENPRLVRCNIAWQFMRSAR